MPHLSKQEKRHLILSIHDIIPNISLEFIYDVAKKHKWNFDETLDSLLSSHQVSNPEISHSSSSLQYRKKLSQLTAIQKIQNILSDSEESAGKFSREEIRKTLKAHHGDVMRTVNILLEKQQKIQEEESQQKQDASLQEESEESSESYLEPVLSRFSNMVESGDPPSPTDMVILSQARMIKELANQVERMCGAQEQAPESSSDSMQEKLHQFRASLHKEAPFPSTLHLMVNMKELRKESDSLSQDCNQQHANLSSMKGKVATLEETLRSLMQKRKQKEENREKRNQLLEKYRQKVREMNARFDQQEESLPARSNVSQSDSDSDHSEADDESLQEEFIVVDEDTEDLMLDEAIESKNDSSALSSDALYAKYLQEKEFQHIDRSMKENEEQKKEDEAKRAHRNRRKAARRQRRRSRKPSRRHRRQGK